MCAGLGPRETEATCPQEAPSVPSALPGWLCARAEGLHYSPGSLLGPQAPCWVWLVRGAGESWEGGLQKGEAGCPLPPRPLPAPHHPLPGLPSQLGAAAEAGSCQLGPLSVPPAPGCQQLPAHLMHISQLPWLASPFSIIRATSSTY